MKEINIVYILDNGYSLPTNVAINSMKFNKNIDSFYQLHLFTNNVSEENKDLIKGYEDNHFKITFYDVDNIDFKLKLSYSSVTPTSIYKFYIPQILKDYKKVLYVDGDIIIQKDLSELYNINIDDYYAAVVKDGPRKKILNGGKKHKFSTEKTYFNSGVMLLNLSILRENNVTNKLIEYRMKEYNYFMDQDAFNIVFKGKVKFLDLKYNTLLHLFTPVWKIHNISSLCKYYDVKKYYDTYDAFFNNAVILHYTFDKPWKYFDINQSDKWYYYFINSTLSYLKLDRVSYLNKYENSKSYKMGKFILYLPRMLKKILKRRK